MDPLIVLLLVSGGFAAGFVNAVAGGGSVITIPILVSIGDASLANGTNRVAVLIQSIVGVAGFETGGKVPWRRAVPLIPATLVGAIGGAVVASRLSPESMRRVFAFVLVLVAVVVVVKPSRWLAEAEPRLTEPWRSLAFLGIGFYGGFVQAGVGFLLLTGLVLGSGLDLIRGNAAKLLLITAYTPIALAVFAGAGQVDLAAGLVLAVGNASGAFVAARLAITKGAGWIRWVLVVAAVVAAVRMLIG